MSIAVRSLFFLVLVMACAFAGGELLAAAPPGNDTCLMCHADKAAKNDQGKLIGVDAPAYKASVHGEMQLTCVMCHVDAADAKTVHPGKLKPVDCAGCHEKAVAEYRGTVHGKARTDGKTLAASCTDCHGTHDIKRSKDPASATNHANLEATCSKCHGSDAYVEKAHLPGGNVGKKYHDSVHGKLLAGKGPEKLAAPECTDCHGTHDIRAKTDPQSRVNRMRVPETCGACHDAVRAEFVGGAHGKLRQQGMEGAPGCNDCHTAHAIQRHDLPEVPARRHRPVRRVPPGPHRDVPRYLPRQGHQPRLHAGGDLRRLPRRARDAAGVRSGLEDLGRRTAWRPARPATRAPVRASRAGTRTRTSTTARAARCTTGRRGSWKCC